MRDSDSAPQDDSSSRSLPLLRSFVNDATSWVKWQGTARIVAGAAVALIAAALGWWLLKAPPPGVDGAIPRVTTVATNDVSETPTTLSLVGGSATITVHVVGAVRHPGVYSLRAPARVVDGLRAAGGSTTMANLEIINLARGVRDGEQLYIPSRSRRTGGASKHPPKPPGSGRIDGGATTSTTSPTQTRLINVNTASAKQLEELPGVGPTTAKAIVDHRIKHGPFLSIDDLANVSGIGPSKLDAMRRYVTV